MRVAEERCLYFGGGGVDELGAVVLRAAAPTTAPTNCSERWEGCSVLNADEMKEHMRIVGPPHRWHVMALYPPERQDADGEAEDEAEAQGQNDAQGEQGEVQVRPAPPSSPAPSSN